MSSHGESDVFVMKLGAETGNVVWARGLGGSIGEDGPRVATTRDGDVLVTFDLVGTMELGPDVLQSRGGTDLVVVRLTSDGTPMRARLLGDAADQHVNGLAVDAAGTTILTGLLQGVMDTTSGPLQSPSGVSSFLMKLPP